MIRIQNLNILTIFKHTGSKRVLKDVFISLNVIITTLCKDLENHHTIYLDYIYCFQLNSFFKSKYYLIGKGRMSETLTLVVVIIIRN